MTRTTFLKHAKLVDGAGKSVYSVVTLSLQAVIVLYTGPAEEVRQPSLRERPMGVTQKYLIVTCNYPARAAGVTKLMGIVEAKKKCPDLILVNGEDLTVRLDLF